MPKHKTEFQIGMETILNNKEASFLRNPNVFNAILSETKMPVTEMIRQIGKQKKSNELSDKQKSEQRLNNLETKIVSSQ